MVRVRYILRLRGNMWCSLRLRVNWCMSLLLPRKLPTASSRTPRLFHDL
jgi:hypothetical protein